MLGEKELEFYQLADRLSDIKTKEETIEFTRAFSVEKPYMYFYEYFNAFVKKNGHSMSEVINSSRINKNYVYNIINGDKKNPSRDKIIALCIGAKMSFAEINEGLLVGEKPVLNPYNKRDVWLAMCINNEYHDVLAVNLLLEEQGMPLLVL